MTAWLFRLHRLDTGQHAAWAVLCVEARYCSLAVPGASTLMRRMLAAADWTAIQAEIMLGLNPGPLPADGALGRALAGDASRTLIAQYVTALPVNARPVDVTSELDAFLRKQPDPSR